jgi:hypothetical protein
METEIAFSAAEKEALDEEDRQLATRDNLVRILDEETTIELFDLDDESGHCPSL